MTEQGGPREGGGGWLATAAEKAFRPGPRHADLARAEGANGSAS